MSQGIKSIYEVAIETYSGENYFPMPPSMNSGGEFLSDNEEGEDGHYRTYRRYMFTDTGTKWQLPNGEAYRVGEVSKITMTPVSEGEQTGPSFDSYKAFVYMSGQEKRVPLDELLDTEQAAQVAQEMWDEFQLHLKAFSQHVQEVSQKEEPRRKQETWDEDTTNLTRAEIQEKAHEYAENSYLKQARKITQPYSNAASKIRKRLRDEYGYSTKSVSSGPSRSVMRRTSNHLILNSEGQELAVMYGNSYIPALPDIIVYDRRLVTPEDIEAFRDVAGEDRLRGRR